MPITCIQTLSTGKQCQAFATKGSTLCFRHNPKQKDTALQASRKGGENRTLQGVYGVPIKLETPEDVKRFLGKVINAVWAESVPMQVGSSMGFLTRCWLDAYEASDGVKRLDKIEEKLNNLNP